MEQLGLVEGREEETLVREQLSQKDSTIATQASTIQSLITELTTERKKSEEETKRREEEMRRRDEEISELKEEIEKYEEEISNLETEIARLQTQTHKPPNSRTLSISTLLPIFSYLWLFIFPKKVALSLMSSDS